MVDSGCGKSTLGSLLLRLYQPDQGHITLDGDNINDVDPSYLRRFIGTVSQEPVLFSTSIRNNIIYGAEDPDSVTQEQLETAAREANAHNFISNFPDGYDTLVGERGVMLSGERYLIVIGRYNVILTSDWLLSGGQKQRVAIARAIIKNPGKY